METKKIAVIDARQHGKVAALAAGYGESIPVNPGEDIYEAAARRFPAGQTGIPDRMSIDRASQFYVPCGEFVGVKVNDEDLTGRVVEFCVSGGWARVTDQPKGTRLTYQQVKDAPKVYGTVEVYWAREPNRQVRRQLARVR